LWQRLSGKGKSAGGTDFIVERTFVAPVTPLELSAPAHLAHGRSTSMRAPTALEHARVSARGERALLFNDVDHDLALLDGHPGHVAGGELAA
jgi:hypothetical protein